MPLTLFYNPYGQENGYRFEVTLMDNLDLAEDGWHEYIAEQCAEDWHNNRDGFEGEWPRVFVLFADNAGPPVARFEVERETVPQFNASPA